VNHRINRIAQAFLGASWLLFLPCPAWAGRDSSAGGLFEAAPETDWAAGWLDAVFRGGALPQSLASGTSSLLALSAAVREALGVFSLGMLVLAGFLLLYRVTVMVMETAHTGVVLGRGTNRLWTPLRFVLAISLLVPVGGGLNAGQHLVIMLAKAGTSLASSAWGGAVAAIKGGFDTFVPPLRPDAARLTVMAFEMEMCRNLYRQLYAESQNDAVLARTGNMVEFQKAPRERLTLETWRYTNALQPGLPLCGEYRFLSFSPAGGDSGENPYNLASFARSDAERLSLQTRGLAERHAASFFTTAPNTPQQTKEVRSTLVALILEQQKALDALSQTMASRKPAGFDQAWDETADAGWMAAGFFTSAIARRQSVLGAQINEALPSAHAPLFGHQAMSRGALLEAVALDPVLRQASASQLDKIATFYDHMNMAIKRMRGWLYGQVLTGSDLVLADTLDVRDLSSSANDADTSAFMFARLVKSAAASYGLWSVPVLTVAGDQASGLSIHNLPGNPIAGMAEIGRRYAAFGRYVMAMTGPVVAEPNTLGSALGFVLFGFAFSAAGFMMLFVLPFFPLARFFLGVLAWVVVVFEAVVALPLVALAHLSPAGEGFSGSLARRAYWLWLGVFMRPILTLLGFVIGLALLTLGLSFLNILFGPLMKPLTSVSGDGLSSVWAGFALLYAVLTMAAVNASFKSIDWLPAHILDWLGGLGLQEVTGPGNLSAGFAASLPSPASSLGASQQIASSSVASQSREFSLAGEGGVSKTSTQSAHGLKSALIPTYQERAVTPTVPAGEEVLAAEHATGVTGSSGYAAAGSSGGPGATAVASATATAQATAVLNPASLREHPRCGEALTSLESLALKPEKRKLIDESDKRSAKADESPEQSSAPPESDKPA
jgi:hypothetical protein